MSRAGPGSTFAARLALAVLLASCLASGMVATMANQLAEGAVRREAVERVTAAAAAVTNRLAADGELLPDMPQPDMPQPDMPQPDAPQPDDELGHALYVQFAALAAEPEVLGMLVVDQRGTVLLNQAGTVAGSAAAPAASPPIRTSLAELARSGRTRATTDRPGSGPVVLTVAVPLRLPARTAALEVQLAGDPMRERAGQLWRALGVALMLGVTATVGLVFLTGGRGLVRRFERVLQAAGSDDLTGLGNRQAFRRDLRMEVEHAARHRLPLTLALIDVNGLETVNTKVGRRRGDKLLIDIGSVLLRAAELAGRPLPPYRIGGDVFALIMAGTALDEAFTLTDALRRRIGLDAAPLTGNVGLSVLDPLRCPDSETLLIAADAALFEARSLGGNRTVGAGDSGTGLRWIATSGAHDRLAP
jgi:diguanylate cyclase (GGDEF)-like protein